MRNRKIIFLIIVFLISVIDSCGVFKPAWKSIKLTSEELTIAEKLQLQPTTVKKLISKPLYQFSEKELDLYLGYLQFIEPNLRKRIQHLARKSVNQKYDIFLLGEFPVEIYDPQPLYSLDKSDCVVFSEHIYAMALSYDWKSFFAMLQRIRYKNGQISLLTRNHYTELDWDRNNSWLVKDITKELAKDRTEYVTSTYDKSHFFSKWGIGHQLPEDTLTWSYLPHQIVAEVMEQLKPGDFVNVIRGYGDNKWVGHVGLITRGPDGIVNFLHSASPKVKEQPLLEYLSESLKQNKEREVKNKEIEKHNKKVETIPGEKIKQPLPYFYGFKFLRLREDPLWELVKIDGFDAPKITIPSIY